MVHSSDWQSAPPGTAQSAQEEVQPSARPLPFPLSRVAEPRFRQTPGAFRPNRSQPVPELARYADPRGIPRPAAAGFELAADLRLVSLNYWLQFGGKPPKSIAIEKSYQL